MVFIHRHISNLRLDVSICRLYSALVSSEVLYAAAPANWVSADTILVPRVSGNRDVPLYIQHHHKHFIHGE